MLECEASNRGQEDEAAVVRKVKPVRVGSIFGNLATRDYPLSWSSLIGRGHFYLAETPRMSACSAIRTGIECSKRICRAASRLPFATRYISITTHFYGTNFNPEIVGRNTVTMARVSDRSDRQLAMKVTACRHQAPSSLSSLSSPPTSLLLLRWWSRVRTSSTVSTALASRLLA